MQKVITITDVNFMDNDAVKKSNNNTFKETEYPKLTKLLEDGYSVRQTIHSITPNTNFFSITFVLENISK
jgi:hypothetical protein